MEGAGFEPAKAEPTDLQSVPFDRSGTPPKKLEQSILKKKCPNVNTSLEIFILKKQLGVMIECNRLI